MKLHENEEGTRERNRCRKMQGQNVKGTGQRKRKGKGIANKGVFKEMKGAETAVKWKDRTWRDRKSKNGKGCPVAGCVASACK